MTHFPREPFPFDLVQIEWQDAMTDEDKWQPFTYEPKLPTVISVGWMIKETKELYMVAATLGCSVKLEGEPFVDMGQVFIIPKGMVNSVKVLLPKATDGK